MALFKGDPIWDRKDGWIYVHTVTYHPQLNLIRIRGQLDRHVYSRTKERWLQDDLTHYRFPWEIVEDEESGEPIGIIPAEGWTLDNPRQT